MCYLQANYCVRKQGSYWLVVDMELDDVVMASASLLSHKQINLDPWLQINLDPMVTKQLLHLITKL